MDSALEPQFNQLKEVIELNYIVSSFQSQRTQSHVSNRQTKELLSHLQFESLTSIYPQ